MNLSSERMCHAGCPRPAANEGFGSLLQNGFYINYLHGLDYLCSKYVTKNSKILELGCFYGTSSRLFREYSNFVTCVDLELYPEMKETIDTHGITFYKLDSIEFLQSIKKGSFDLIYIDTTHDFGRTKSEILLAYEKLENNGYLAGHDYNCAGVHNAILDVFKYPRIEIFLDSSWVIQKNEQL